MMLYTVIGEVGNISRVPSGPAVRFMFLNIGLQPAGIIAEQLHFS